MSTTTKRIAGVMLGLALVATAAAPASAQTTAAQQAQIAALQAQIAALQAQMAAGTSSCSFTFTRDLRVGSTGADVMQLQRFLNASADTRIAASGAGSPGLETTYYGPLTAAAVSRFQVKYRAEILTPNGLVNPTGYFGASSRAKANALCVGNPTTPPTTPGDDDDDDNDSGDLEGGAGSLEDADWMSSLNNEEVGEDEEDAEVAGLELEADNGSDLELTAVRVDFDYADTGASDDLDDYASEVSIWLDGEEFGRADIDDLDDDDWSKTISLDDGAIIRAGEVGELVIAVSGQENLDSDDLGENWNVDVESVRFKDADGATITDDETGDIGATATEDTTTNAGERQFSFESFASAADTELHITLGSDEINDSSTITVEDSEETEDVDVFAFNVEVEGDADVNLDQIEVDFDFTGTATTLDDVFSSLCLEMDGEEVGCETVPAADSVTFEDLDLDLTGGDEYEFVVVGDILDLDNNTFEEGDTITGRITSTERDAWEAEDSSGEDLEDTDKTGTATGEAHALFESGITVEAVSTDSSKNEAETVGTFEIVVDITAFGEDAYIHELAHTASSTDAGFEYTIYKGGTATSTTMTVSDLVSTAADDSGEYFVIDEGTTERFTLTVTVDPGTGGAGLYTVELDNVRFDPDHAADSVSTDDLRYAVPSSEDVETPAESLVAS